MLPHPGETTRALPAIRSRVIPHVRPPAWPDLPPSRLAHAFRRDNPAGCRVALLGLPDDLGVRLNFGRPGAAAGPDALRRALASYGAADSAAGTPPPLFDAGDVIPADGSDPDALLATHDRVFAATTALLNLGLFPVALGGGHDLTFPFVRAVSTHLASRGVHLLAGEYADAHLDVRDSLGSGMPFRRLVTVCGVRTLVNRGLNPLVTSREHLDWFRSHGGRVEEPGRPGLPPHTPQFASLDLDVLDCAFAPGVSALNPRGWSPALAEAWVIDAASRPGLACFDLMEFNPAHDEGGRTARLAAHLLLTFLLRLSASRWSTP